MKSTTSTKRTGTWKPTPAKAKAAAKPTKPKIVLPWNTARLTRQGLRDLNDAKGTNGKRASSANVIHHRCDINGSMIQCTPCLTGSYGVGSETCKCRYSCSLCGRPT